MCTVYACTSGSNEMEFAKRTTNKDVCNKKICSFSVWTLPITFLTENNNNNTNTTSVDNVNNAVHTPNLVGVLNNISKVRTCDFCGLLGHNKCTGPQIVTNGKFHQYFRQQYRYGLYAQWRSTLTIPVLDPNVSDSHPNYQEQSQIMVIKLLLPIEKVQQDCSKLLRILPIWSSWQLVMILIGEHQTDCKIRS